MHYKTGENQGGLFDYQQRCRELAARGTGLDRLNAAVDWAAFRPVLAAHLAYGDGAAGGRPAWDPVLMFKVLVLQKYHGLSDEQAEFQILDRFSFQRFLGLGVGDKVPDQKTIWVFKERLGAAGVRELFERFLGELADQQSDRPAGQNRGRQLCGRAAPAQLAAGQRSHPGRRTPRALGRKPGLRPAERHRRALGHQGSRDAFRLQKPHQGRRADQVHRRLHGHTRQRA